MEHLSTEVCWQLLTTSPIGRIGVLVDSAPEVYPVNFRVDGRSVLFRSDPGTKLRGLDRSPSVCFEVDGFDDGDRSGWSVLVKGRAQELTDAADVRAAEATPLDPWGHGPKSHWIRIVPAEVTGRRLHVRRDHPRASWSATSPWDLGPA